MDDIKVYRGADLTMPTAVAISGTGGGEQAHPD